MCGKKIAQKMLIFAQFLEKFAQKTKRAQILVKFTQFSKVAQYMQSSQYRIFISESWKKIYITVHKHYSKLYCQSFSNISPSRLVT